MASNRGSVPWLQDADVTLYHGDVLAVLPELPAESVDCVVTSPPYWGLRDYGTGAWEGGDAECQHSVELGDGAEKWDSSETHERPFRTGAQYTGQKVTGNTCKCGATRIDQQLGLEPTPEQYVERMVEVFREVRRVLAPHGTVWLNLGDSYASSPPGNTTKGVSAKSTLHGVNDESGRYRETLSQSVQTRRNTVVGDLKPKDLVGIPWRVAFALQADGWYLRSDIIWAKPNPMPESVTDRPTKAHEYVFLLSKQPRYFFDAEAVREAHKEPWRSNGKPESRGFDYQPHSDDLKKGRAGITRNAASENRLYNPAGRNIRSVWEIATQPYPEAHFATFPEELARRCIAAGCPEQVCRVCGKARERVVEREVSNRADGGKGLNGDRADGGKACNADRSFTTLGFTDCNHSDYRPGIVIDPFIGSGTVAHVARKLGRHAVGIDLSAEYLALAARRLQQQSLFAEPVA